MIQMSLQTIFRLPADCISNIFKFFSNNSRSNLLVVMDEIKEQNYKKYGQLNLKANLMMIHKFYTEELENHCAKNQYNVIRELEFRKNELEQDLNYYIGITIGIITGILATVITNFYSFWFSIIRKDMTSLEYMIINAILLISIVIVAFLFFPIVRFVIHSFRKNVESELQILDQYELKIISEILNKKTSEMLK